MNYKTKGTALVACMLAIGVASMPQNALAQQPSQCSYSPQQTAQTRPIELGVSGGNINSLLRANSGKLSGCYSGTLGSLVEDATDTQYILSNNHVLADQNTAKPGDLIVQPGLVDVECLKAPSNAVATFSGMVRLKFNGSRNYVDAAIAAVNPGDVSPEIAFIGGISSSPATATIGMAVQKMGRTTCLTFGAVAQLDAHLRVNYSDTKRPKPAKFVDQIVVSGSLETPQFSAAGDSGSLIVTDDDCPQPVALLFAGSASGLTIANPISTVLSALNVSMVGTCTASLSSDSANAELVAGGAPVSKEAVAVAAAVRDRHEDSLMSIPGAVGTGIGAGDHPGQTTIVLYVDKLTPQAQAAAPKEVEGTPVKLIESGEFVAY
ncbi:MAG: hypothetical protein WAU82_08465 [Candidatus Binatus sp.]|uniref:hypothetical protein n=1 Tax=Candidatus Binatus sp. TaxID=2811406 RepID=UPI003BAEF141